MSDEPDTDQKTEAPTAKRRRDAAEKGDVLQSRELGTALVVLVGAAWIALAGPMMMAALQDMVEPGPQLRCRRQSAISIPAARSLRLLGMVVLPVLGLFALTLVAAVAAPAMLGSLGFRGRRLRLQGQQAQPADRHEAHVRHAGADRARQVDRQGASCSAAIGLWLVLGQTRAMSGSARRTSARRSGRVGHSFTVAVLVMAAALAADRA